MCHVHCTITPASVRATAREALQGVLPWKPFGRRVRVARIYLEVGGVDDVVNADVDLCARVDRPEFGLGDVGGDDRAAVLAVGLHIADQPRELASDPDRLVETNAT